MRRDAPPAAFLRALRGWPLLHTGVVLCLLLGGAESGSADCGEGLDAVERAVGVELAGLRVDAETAREAEALTQGSETAFQALHRYRPEKYPPDYDAALHRRVRALHRETVAPERRRLTELRDRAEAAWLMQERRVRERQTFFFDAAAAYREERLDRAGFCRVRAAYAAGLDRYRAASARYRSGLQTYAAGLGVYRERFLDPARRGFHAPVVWTALIARFETEGTASEFLQSHIDVLSTAVEAEAPSDIPSDAIPDVQPDASPAP